MVLIYTFGLTVVAGDVGDEGVPVGKVVVESLGLPVNQGYFL